MPKKRRTGEQLGLTFASAPESAGANEATLAAKAEVAIGEYLARGKKIYPNMPIARLLGALGRQGIAPEHAARALELIGAQVTEVPTFVAKFNYRVTFPPDVLDRCRRAYQSAHQSAA
ncbi:MAG TPA: hypothetical protein VNM72_16090 [Blastocatellia bacterium]|nr:hypothetical protein [Blastocatellia bacterium]